MKYRLPASVQYIKKQNSKLGSITGCCPPFKCCLWPLCARDSLSSAPCIKMDGPHQVSCHWGGAKKKKSWGIFAMCAVSICGPMVPRLVWPWPGRGPAWRMTTDINAWMYETAGIWPKSTSAANTRHLFLMNLSIWWDVTCPRRPHCIFGWDFYCWHLSEHTFHLNTLLPSTLRLQAHLTSLKKSKRTVGGAVTM